MIYKSRPAPITQPCAEALKKLEQAKTSGKECVKYNICPACGASLMRIKVGGTAQKKCLSCSFTHNVNE